MPGMRMSETTTSHGARSSSASASAPLGGEEHLPLVALRAQRVAQAVEHLLLVVDEEDPRHAATCVSRGC